MKEFVEKLIGRLEELKTMHLDMANDNTGVLSEYDKNSHIHFAGCYSKSIEIVNQLAGEYNNVFCEWKLDGVYLMCQHKTELFVSCLEDEKHRYKYCPICGKKIKVVE